MMRRNLNSKENHIKDIKKKQHNNGGGECGTGQDASGFLVQRLT